MRINRSFVAVLLGVLALVLSNASMAATYTFDVFAKENSTAILSGDASPLNTGLFINAGDALSFSASGLWNGGGCGDFDANGTTCFGTEGTTGINFYSLIGKIGGSDTLDNTWFKIGTSFSGVASTSGTLYLAYLDNDSFNNSGSVNVLVSVNAVPEPESLGMLLAGLGLVTLIQRRRKLS